MNRLPDFIIIGAMKAATSTLHEQLARQDGVFMSTPKEPEFFCDDKQWQRGLAWYCSLFDSAKATDLCGESSTSYSKLPNYPDTVSRLRRYLVDTKFIYIIRHPIDRLISQYIHQWSLRNISCSLEQAINRYPQLIQYSLYAMQLRPYIETFGPSKVLVVFFERLCANPSSEFEHLCQFIGLKEKPKWYDQVSHQNASNQRIRLKPWRDVLLKLPCAISLARALLPKGTRDRIWKSWTMHERPQLSLDTTRRLESIFDEDLAELASWPGIKLSCATFKEVVLQSLSPSHD